MNTPDPRISAILERWQALRGSGQEVPLEELCRDCPELLPEVRARVAALATGPEPTPGALPETLVPEPDDPFRTAAPTATLAAEGVPDPSAAAPPGYTILGELGRGGMGVVYHARQVGLGRSTVYRELRRARADGFTPGCQPKAKAGSTLRRSG